MMKFHFDEPKAISCVLYISEKLLELKDVKAKPGLHKIFKILYFADQKHLARYGRPIMGDYYVAMEHGPVPSNVYDILKAARGDSLWGSRPEYEKYFSIKGHDVYPNVNADVELMSESDLECISESIDEHKFMTFDELRKKSHDAAYDCASKDDKIPYRLMAELAGADESMLSYIKSVSDNERLLNQ